MTTFYLLILFMLPAVMAVGIAIPRRRELSAQWVGELVIATALLVLGAAGFAFAEPVVTLFRRSDPEVIRIGTETFRIQILTVWAWGFITLSNMYTQAIGYGIRSTILAAARQGLFLIPTLLVLPNVWGLRGLEVCQPLADVLTLALAVWMMTKVIRTQKAQMAQETA